MIDASTRAFVTERAARRCEYCLLPQAHYDAAFNVDHIVARQHGGDDRSDNLALSCPKYNRKKGPNLSGVDPQTGQVESLFNPRQGAWNVHFRWNAALVVGITPTGRATVAALGLNDPQRVGLRQSLIAEGLSPAG